MITETPLLSFFEHVFLRQTVLTRNMFDFSEQLVPGRIFLYHRLLKFLRHLFGGMTNSNAARHSRDTAAQNLQQLLQH